MLGTGPVLQRAFLWHPQKAGSGRKPLVLFFFFPTDFGTRSLAIPRGGYIPDNLELPLQSRSWWVCRAGVTFCLRLGTGRRLGGGSLERDPGQYGSSAQMEKGAPDTWVSVCFSLQLHTSCVGITLLIVTSPSPGQLEGSWSSDQTPLSLFEVPWGSFAIVRPCQSGPSLCELRFQVLLD